MAPSCFTARSWRNGFTLVELLVVASVIAILVALLFPAALNAMSMGDRAKMTAQMRTLATAVIQYAGDNDGTLPGPLLSSLNFRYNVRHPEFLMTPLSPYLGFGNPESQNWQNFNALMTPKQLDFRQDYNNSHGGDSAHFFVIYVDGPVLPFGWSHTVGSTPPMKIHAIPKPATTAMFMEGDQSTSWPSTNKNNYARSTFPSKPLHGRVRFNSYFDGSVQQISTKK